MIFLSSASTCLRGEWEEAWGSSTLSCRRALREPAADGGRLLPEKRWNGDKSGEPAFELARRENKRFCRLYRIHMYQLPLDGSNIFPLAAVQNELEKIRRLQLFTDGEGGIRRESELPERAIGTVALPLYAILDSQGRRSRLSRMTRKPEGVPSLCLPASPFEIPQAGSPAGAFP